MQTSRSPRGRTGALHRQAVARAMALAWRQLTGQKECQVQRPAPGCDRHYVRTSPQRAKFGIGDKDGGGPQRGRESLGPNREPSKQMAHNHSIGAYAGTLESPKVEQAARSPGRSQGLD